MPKLNMYQAIHTTVKRQRPALRFRSGPRTWTRWRAGHRAGLQGRRKTPRQQARPPAHVVPPDYSWQGCACPRRAHGQHAPRLRAQPHLRLHPQGRGEGIAAGRYPARLRLYDPLRRGPPVHRRAGERAHGAAALPPANGRCRGSVDLEKPDPPPRLGGYCRHGPRAHAHPQHLRELGMLAPMDDPMHHPHRTINPQPRPARPQQNPPPCAGGRRSGRTWSASRATRASRSSSPVLQPHAGPA